MKFYLVFDPALGGNGRNKYRTIASESLSVSRKTTVCLFEEIEPIETGFESKICLGRSRFVKCDLDLERTSYPYFGMLTSTTLSYLVQWEKVMRCDASNHNFRRYTLPLNQILEVKDN